MHRHKLWRASQDAVTNWLISLLAILLTSASASAQQTVTNSQLQTWWHSNYELNATTAVADNAVRRSTHYDVRVGSGSAPTTYYDSYTYMSIPRGGRDKWGYTEEDGAEFADAANLTMSWSSFLFSTDAWVEVSLRGGQTISSIDEVTIRPTNLNFQKQLVDPNTIRIRVPYESTGYRFSVEFNNQLYTAYNDMSGVSGQLTTQAGGHREVHTEPRNALLIFAEPMLSGSEANRLIPHDSDGTIYYVPEGQVNNLNNVSAEIVYFRPGTYYMPWNYHALLPAHVKWVYLAPGAFVKGAFRFPSDNQGVYKVTGYGALSGEKYVYEADTANGYQHSTGSNCHASCVKMLQFQSSNAQQYLDLQGVTIVEPPYHSFVVYGNEDTFQMRVENYKQVGSWYWQTDGIELYTNSTMKNTFFNANDDVLKIYHSGVTIDNTVIWKNENGPVIQWGWVPRNIQNIAVRNTNVIHNRMYWKDVKINTCVVNASPHWEDTGSTTRGDPNSWVRNILIENTRIEGKVNCAVRIHALSSTENVHIKNLEIDAWNDLDIGSQVSHLKRYSNSGGQKVTLGTQGSAGASGKGIKLENYSVGGVAITRSADNWRANQLGRLGFDADTYDNWDAFGGGTQNPSAPRWVGGTFTNWALTSMAATGSGLYELTRNLAAGNHQLKFADSNNWTGRDWGGANGLTGTAMETTGGGPNITFNVAASGEYLIRFNSSTLQYSIASTTTTQPIWVAGTFSNWSLGSMTATSTGYQAVRTLSAGNHELKFANTGNWSGTDWGNATGLSGTLTDTTGGLPNVKFTIAQSGSYIIQFNLQTLAYSINPAP